MSAPMLPAARLPFGRCGAGGTSMEMVQFVVCMMLAVQPISAVTPGPGKEPSSSPRGYRDCSPGYYKSSTGKFPCSQCPVGSVTPTFGHSSCIKCPSGKTSNCARTFCVTSNPSQKSPGCHPQRRPSPKPKTTPSPISTKKLEQSKFNRAHASVYGSAAFPCRPEPGPGHEGATRCGIPVGYADNNRTGAIYLPNGYKNKPSPVMILLHGSGITGNEMINTFYNLADQYKYIIVAPDSHNDMYWDVPTTYKDPWSQDFWHIQACYERAMKFPGVVPDKRFISIFGNSRAGFAAPAFASRSPIGVNSAVIIHAAALPQQCGYRVMPILWTTGSKDPLYGPTVAVKDKAFFHKLRPEYPITYRVWLGSHTIRNYTELGNMIEWWLKPSTRRFAAPPLSGRR